MAKCSGLETSFPSCHNFCFFVVNIDGLRLSLLESFAEAIVLWKSDLDSDAETAAVLDLCGIRIIYAEDILSFAESIELRNRTNGDSEMSGACSHLSKACWISMSCGENNDEPIGYITEVKGPRLKQINSTRGYHDTLD